LTFEKAKLAFRKANLAFISSAAGVLVVPKKKDFGDKSP
jgi:hypothetical protein